MALFSFLKRKNTPPVGTTLQEFTFIWYKKMVSGNSISYTAPYRTTVLARDREDAKHKIFDFANRSMKLVIINEVDFPKSDLGKMQDRFNAVNKQMADLIGDKHTMTNE